MKALLSIVSATMLVAPSVALAQATPGADTATNAVDPARLDAAKRVIDQVSPPAERDKLADQLIRPMLNNVRQAMAASPEFSKIFAEDSALRLQFDNFIQAELDRSLRLIKESMPAMFDAMARAYARRFTADQLAEISRFFDTPAGKAYAQQAPTILNDPDVQAAQRNLMARSLEGLQDRVQAMAAKIKAEADKGHS